MTVRILTLDSEAALYHRYPGETVPQPCYVELDLREGLLSADWDALYDGAVPLAVHHGFHRRYPIALLTAAAVNNLMERLAPLADRILADWGPEWDDRNMIAVLGADARAAEAELAALVAEYGSDQGGIQELLVTVADLTVATNGAEAAEFGITADTTDERLEEIAEQLRAGLVAASPSGAVVLDDTVPAYLRQLRDDAGGEPGEVW